MKADAERALARKVDFLSAPGSYDPPVTAIEARETHMSWIFLTPDRVFKLKKPVRRPFLDFSTIARRRFFCEEEVRLNRRLAAETYVGTRPLRRLASGVLSLGGGGRVADWLVEMLRLPGDDMLDRRLTAASATAGSIRAVAEKLAGFYRGLTGEVPDAGRIVARMEAESRLNRSLLLRREFALADPATGLLDRTDRLLAEIAPEIGERARGGIMVEGHGDLRPEHVCLGEPLQIIDCLEFNRDMRIVDPYDEIGYLALECEVLGAPWVRPILVDILRERIGRPPSGRLAAFYGAYRALLRARLSIAHLLERPVRKPGKWRPLTLAYLAQADRELITGPSREDRRASRSRAGMRSPRP
jgi:aminoglycoside phosphotransferase family enzyme